MLTFLLIQNCYADTFNSNDQPVPASQQVRSTDSKSVLLAENIATINDLSSRVDLNPYIEYIEDPTGNITIEQLNSGQYENRWVLNSEKFFIGKNIESTYWFRLSIRNTDSNYNDAIIHIENHFGLIARLGIKLPATGVHEGRNITGGQFEPFQTQQLYGQQYAYNISVPPGETKTVLGWFNNSEAAIPTLFPIYISSENQYHQTNQLYTSILTAFYSVLGALLLYNFCLFITLKQLVYGLYVLFLASAVFTTGFLDGTLTKLLFPKSPNLNQYFGMAFNFIISMSYLAFIYYALDGVTFLAWFKRAYLWMIRIGFLFLILLIATGDFFVAATLSQLYIIVTLALCLYTIIYAVRIKVATSAYLLIAELMTALGSVVFMLMLHGILQPSGFTTWGIHWGIGGEVLLLSLAVAARTNIAIKDKLAAQELAYQNESKALEALEVATKTKNQFLTTVSHELRTPLNSIIGFSSVLLDDKNIKGSHRDYTRTIANNGKQLLAVINDVLNLSLIDSNKLAITNRAVELPDLIKGLEVKYRLHAQRNNVSFDIYTEGQLPDYIEVDGDHLIQVLQQLLDNAFKFTHQGSVRLSIRVKNNNLLFTLADTGIGISKDKLDLVFAPFTQVDSSNARRYSGTGVGLFIAKAVTEKMGGTLTVESTKGEGTRFSLIVPYKEAEKPAEDTSQEQTRTIIQAAKTDSHSQVSINIQPKLNGSILYAEDNIDNQRLVKLWVEKTGATIILVENGKQAVEEVRKQSQPFDLILMDLQMPVMDGYAATSEIRQHQQGGQATPVIACSASAIADIESESRVVFDGYLSKPINKDQLYAVLKENLLNSTDNGNNA